MLLAPIARARELLATNYGTHRGFVRLALANIEYSLGRLEGFCDRDVSSVTRLVFACLGNINRSCFAEQVARLHGVRAVSLGLSTTTGARAFATAVEIAPRFQVDLREHRTIDYSDFQFMQGDLVLCMEIRHARALVTRGFPSRSIRLLGRWATPVRLHIHDPHTLSLPYFFTCFTTIQSAVVNLVEDLRDRRAPAVEGDR